MEGRRGAFAETDRRARIAAIILTPATKTGCETIHNDGTARQESKSDIKSAANAAAVLGAALAVAGPAASVCAGD